MAPHKTAAQKTARYLIIEALATHGPLTHEELADRIPKLRPIQIKNNVASAKAPGYVKVTRDDVSGQPLVTLTNDGFGWWSANKATDIPPTMAQSDLHPAAAPAESEDSTSQGEDQATIIAAQQQAIERLHEAAVLQRATVTELNVKMANFWAVLASYAPSYGCASDITSVTKVMDQLVHAQLAHIAKQESELIDLRNRVEILQQAHEAERVTREHYGDETSRFRELLDRAKYVVRAPRRDPVFATKESNARRAAAAAVRSGVNAQIFTLIPYARAKRGVAFESSK